MGRWGNSLQLSVSGGKGARGEKRRNCGRGKTAEGGAVGISVGEHRGKATV